MPNATELKFGDPTIESRRRVLDGTARPRQPTLGSLVLYAAKT